jgi:hypothetical protein
MSFKSDFADFFVIKQYKCKMFGKKGMIHDQTTQ